MLVTGCTGTKQIPRGEYASASGERKLFTIRMVDDSRYVAWNYSVTDSTLVIEALSKKDERYDTAALPIVVPLEEVQSVEKFGSGPSFKQVAILLVAVPAIAIVAIFLGADWND